MKWTDDTVGISMLRMTMGVTMLGLSAYFAWMVWRYGTWHRWVPIIAMIVVSVYNASCLWLATTVFIEEWRWWQHRGETKP